MATVDPGLKFAITPPTADTAAFHRPKLVDRLLEFLPRRLILVTAPAGYGKTSLLVDFNETGGVPVCWVRLTPADRDEIRMASVLAASLTRRFRRLSKPLRVEMLGGVPPEALARCFTEPISDLIDSPFAIVFDDVQTINPSKTASGFLDALIGQMPDFVTVIASGRELPEVSMSQWVVDAQVGGIGSHELALTLEETGGFLRERFGLELDDDSLTRLHQETQGWFTGVLLAGERWHREPGWGASDVRQAVYEYLQSNAGGLGEGLRSFLLESSVLPVMTAPWCDHILRRSDSQAILRQVVDQGLFITTTATTPESYQYHPLFRGYLQEELRREAPDHQADLQRRAAELMAELGRLEEAFDLYADAGEWDTGCSLAETHCRELFFAGRVRTLEDWADRLQSNGMIPTRTLLHVASSMVEQARLDSAYAFIHKALESKNAADDPEIQSRAHSLLARVAYQRGDFRQALDDSSSAVQISQSSGDSSRWATACRIQAMTQFRLGDSPQEAEESLRLAAETFEQLDEPYNQAMALCDMMVVLDSRGKALELERAALKVTQLLQDYPAPGPLAISSNNLAVLAHLQGHYDYALKHFADGLRFARQIGNHRYETILLLGQADLFNDLSQHFQAGDLYGEALRLAKRWGIDQLLSYGYLGTSILHTRCGTYRLASEWLARARAAAGEGVPQNAIRIQQAGLEIMVDPEEATKSLQNLERELDGTLQPKDATRLAYLLAVSHHAQDDERGTGLALERALFLAGAHSSEQVLAGELNYDEIMRSTSARLFPRHPVMASILHRIEHMRSFVRAHESGQTAREQTLELQLRGLGRSMVGEITELEPLQRELVFFLADHQPIERDRILEALWPGSPVGRQVSSLYTAVHSVKMALGKEAVQIDGPVYRLSADRAIRYDVAAFEQAADVALAMAVGDPRRLFALHQALQAYKGAFLPEFTSDWALQRRRGLERTYLTLLSEHANEALNHGQPERAVESLRRAVEIDPLRDDLNIRYLRVLGQLGRRSDVIGHYQNYVRLLADELGLDPPAEARQLYQDLLD